jgi:5-hydroxyisourate hydrolase-like protein (transthyretin family)
MHSGDAKIADFIGEHLQTKEKNQNGRGRVGAGSRKGNREEEGAYQICFLRGEV